MKKITALLLAVMLVLSLSITAFAAGTEEPTTGKTITVNGAENDKNYELYKIFNISEINGSVAYSIPTDRNYTSNADFNALFDTHEIDGVTYVSRKADKTDEEIVNWAKNNVANFGTVIATKQTTNGQVVFDNLADGYYYVKSPVSNGATIMLADTRTQATINEKNSTPGWGDNGGKTTENGETFYAGDTIHYKLTYNNAVNYNGNEKVTQYVIEDTLPEGITYARNLVVKVNGNVVPTTNLLPEGSTVNGFKVSIPWVDGEGNSCYTVNPSVITVTYDATMGNTKIAEGITNHATINPNTSTEDPGKKVTVYTGQIELIKKDNEQQTVLLPGAVFKVKVGTNEYLQEIVVDGKTTYTAGPAENATEFTTDTNGKITLKGLKAGTYTFEEIKAPAGYQLPADSNVAVVTLELTKDEDGNVTATTAMSKTQDVLNSKAAAMPMTGGMGTTLFYVVGSLLAVGAVVLLITKKRMQAVQ